jgi:hypothetical protein
MSIEDRVDAILAKVKAIAEAPSKSTELADAVAASPDRTATENAWIPLRNSLDAFVREMDGKMPDRLKPSIRQLPHGLPRDLVNLELALGRQSLGNFIPAGSDLPAYLIQVTAAGDIIVRMGTGSYPHVKKLHVRTATADNMTEIVFELIEANL